MAVNEKLGGVIRDGIKKNPVKLVPGFGWLKKEATNSLIFKKQKSEKNK